MIFLKGSVHWGQRDMEGAGPRFGGTLPAPPKSEDHTFCTSGCHLSCIRRQVLSPNGHFQPPSVRRGGVHDKDFLKTKTLLLGASCGS